ncbi:restriction endonuclease subunit S [Novosphingobium sp. Gsoil 351]|uniref:restriction endonuclease subunit S n=1 Tax=Novosphingobium sp. Gsoil 351 TaxID=2675225 RepID=UPI0012B442F6|nr:restriction endonuclease subunit S [Novosphingobium sp. Gsoil 351]QGN55904.1 restriction endonuclease subunit S [Novosphingobium sp. Gsoil 351]
MTWKEVPLGEVIRQRKSFITIDDDVTYKRCRVQTSARGVVLRDAVPGGEIKTKKQQVCRAGDFLVAEIDAKAGGYGLVPSSLEGAVVSSHYFLFEVDEAELDREYLGWFSRTGRFFNQVRAVGSTNYAAIRPGSVLQYTMPLPPLCEQRRIVAQLDTAATAVTRAEKLIDEVHQDLLQAARNIIWRAGEDANAWVSCGSFLQQRPLDVRVDPATDYAFAGVFSFGRGIFRSEVKAGSTFSYPTLTRIKTDDFIYPKLMAWEGALGIVSPECNGLVVSPEFPVFEIDADVVQPAVVDTFFRDPRVLPMLRSASSGTNMRRRRIQPSRFLELKMPIPSPKDQAFIRALLHRRNTVLEARRDSLAAVKALLPAMLNNSFGTGAGG